MGGDALFPTYEVHIINDLPTNSHFFLLVRCQSKDDDFGMHKLESGEEFCWRFKPNIIKTTLFFCHFYWDTKDAIFNVYDRKLDDDYCYKFNTCYWSVRDDGFYFSGDNTAVGFLAFEGYSCKCERASKDQSVLTEIIIANQLSDDCVLILSASMKRTFTGGLT
ncbi:hypothetical protein ACSBR2_030700 [Camellia fascicularis]